MRLQMPGLGLDVTRLGEAKFEPGDLPLLSLSGSLKQSTPTQGALRPDLATVSCTWSENWIFSLLSPRVTQHSW